jgi:opacity protein-like surface antigen
VHVTPCFPAYFLSLWKKSLPATGDGLRGTRYALTKQRQIVAVRDAYGGTVPLLGSIFTDVLFAFICRQKTYLVSGSGPSIAPLQVRRHEIIMRGKSRIFRSLHLAFLAGSFAAPVLKAQTPASEGTRSGTTEITFFAGVSAPVNHESKGFGLDVKTGTPIGGRVSYNFNRHNAIEFSIANPFSLSANYVYNFSALRPKWVPYVTAGVGGTRQEIALSDNNQPARLNSNLMETGPDRSQTAFTGNFGGGAKYFFTERFALRFDVRDQVGHYKATFSNVAGVPGGIVTGSKTLNDFQITGGIVFRFRSKR